MSRIFDALQRSESERSGAATAALPQGPDLLKQAERRVVSTWEAGAANFGREAANTEEDREAARREADLPARITSTIGTPERLSADRSLDVFSQFASPQISPTAESRLVCLTDPENPTAEAIRLLGVRLRGLRRKQPLKKVLITSTIPREGKSTISANLACALARASDQRTLLVEGDLRRPSLAHMFGVQTACGMIEWLREGGSASANIYRLHDAGLWLMPAGRTSGNPIEFLQSQRLPELMEQLAAWFDWIIIDSPPVLPLADTSVWMRLADGVLLVTRQGTTEKRQLQKGLEALDHAKLLGALVNGSRASAYSEYYYSPSIPS